MDQICRIKQLLAQQFVIKDLGAAKCYMTMCEQRERMWSFDADAQKLGGWWWCRCQIMQGLPMVRRR